MTRRKPSGIHRWIRRVFLLWAVFSTAWLANSIRTRGVDDDMLRSNPAVSVVHSATTLAFLPTASDNQTALVFICGSGISAKAYAPLLRPVAEAGYPVFIVKLPYRFAPLESHKQAAVERVRGLFTAHPEVSRWVLSGHSLGAALAARLARSDARALAAMVLVGTTHPKEDDLSALLMPITKVFASNDGIAPPDRVRSSRRLLPPQTKWVEIPGGNHSQFGRYGHQLFDGTATIGREEQEAITRAAILEALAAVAGNGFAPDPGA